MGESKSVVIAVSPERVAPTGGAVASVRPAGASVGAVELLSAVGKTGAGSMLSLLFGALTMKIMAIVAGPAGLGLFSLVRQTSLTGMIVATLNGQGALVQGIASRRGSARHSYLSGALTLLALSISFVALLMVLAAPWVAGWIFPGLGSSAVAGVRWVAVAVVVSSLYSALTAILNGHQAIGRLAVVQAGNVGLMALLALPAARAARDGNPVPYSWLLIAATGAGSVAAFHIARANGWLPRLAVYQWQSLLGGARAFGRVAAVLLTSGALVYGAQLLIRTSVARVFGLAGAGMFDVAWTFSMTYVVLFLTSFQTYYLPALSQASSTAERSALVHRVFRLATLVLVPIITSVVVLKPLIVHVLYSDAFLPATAMMSWMLIGDFVKVSAWILAMPMLAMSDLRPLLWSDVAWSASWFVASAILILEFGWMEGVGAAFAVCYSAYLLVVYIIAKRLYRIRMPGRTALHWLIGLAVVGGASLSTWYERQVDWRVAAAWIGIAVVYSAFSLSRRERQQVAAIGGVIGHRIRRSEAL